MYSYNDGYHFYSSTPITKGKNKNLSNLHVEYTIKKLLKKMIDKSLDKCLKEMERKLRRNLLTENSLMKKREKQNDKSYSSVSTWSSEFSSIEKPRKQTLSEIDYTNITSNSLLNHSNIGVNSSLEKASEDCSRSKIQSYENLFKSLSIKIGPSSSCDSNAITSITELSQSSEKRSNFNPKETGELFTDNESILDMENEEKLNFLISKESYEKSLRKAIGYSISKINNTIDRKELENLKFDTTWSSSRDLLELSSYKSQDLYENRKFADQSKQCEINVENNLDSDILNLNPSIRDSSDQKKNSGEVDLEKDSIISTILKSSEKVRQWLEERSRDNKGTNDDHYIVSQLPEDHLYSVSEVKTSIDSDLLVNYEKENIDDVNESNPVYHMQFKYPSENIHKNAVISVLKESMKKNVVTEDEGMYSHERKESWYSLQQNVRLLSSTIRSKKNQVIHEYNKSKFPIIEDSNEIGFDISKENFYRKGNNKKIMYNFLNRKTILEDSQVHNNSHYSSMDSRDSRNENAFQQSENSCNCKKISKILDENKILKEILDNYMHNSDYRDKRTSKEKKNEEKFNKFLHAFNETLKNCEHNVKQTHKENNRLRNIIVEQTVLFINEYQTRQ